MAMSELHAAEQLKNIYLPYRDANTNNGGLFILRNLERILDNEFQLATPTRTNIDITTPAGTLYFGDLTENDVYRIPYIIGEEVARYWSTTIEITGEPESCDDIEEVTNDALKIAIPIAEDLIAQASTISITEPYYVRFFEIIFKHVRTIIWTVKESDSTCDTTFDDVQVL